MESNYIDAVSVIVENVDIVDLISQYVELKKSGNSFRGLCPFHGEKTPSFFVNQEKKLFHCFGCGVGGNVISFVMKYNNFEFRDAILSIASKYGLNIGDNKSNKSNARLYSIYEDLYYISRKYLDFDSGNSAALYMKKRGFEKDICDKFGIGFLPDNINIEDLLKRYDRDTIKSSKLFYFKDYNNNLRFGGRLLIPIKNTIGKICAFSGRVIDDSLPKYINSAETDIFKKREIVYNLNLAKDITTKSKYVIVVEGYFDVINLYAHGFENTVSIMGTSISKEQITLLRRYFEDIIIVFDGDQAGYKAAYRSLDIFIQSSYIPYVVFPQRGDDPDSIMRENGPSYFASMLDKKEDLLISVIKKYTENINSINDKVKLLDNIKNKIKKLTSSYMRDHYIEQVGQILKINYEVLRKNFDVTTLKTGPKIKSNNNMVCFCEYDFLRYLLKLPEDVIGNILSDMEEEYFTDPFIKKVYKKTLEILGKGDIIHLLMTNNDIGEELVKLLMDNIEEKDNYLEAIRNKNKLVYNYLERQRKMKIKELAVIGKDNSSALSLLSDIQSILSKQTLLKKHMAGS